MLQAAAAPPPPSYQQSVGAPSSSSRGSERAAPRREQFAAEKHVSNLPDEKVARLEKSMSTQRISSRGSITSKDSMAEDEKAEAALVDGCPALLVPNNDDWAPSERDLAAPAILPARTMGGRMRTMWSRSAGKPLKPMPASFHRTPPAPSHSKKDPLAPTYSTFKPFYVPGKDKKHLQEGFEPRYPADIMVDHNVSAVDWDRFLVNIRVAGALRGREHLIANLAPAPLIVLHAAYGNYFITKAIMSKFKKRHVPEVLALIETYQHRFFQPRGLDVFIAMGTQRISGHFPGDTSYEEAPPVVLGFPLNIKEDSSSSSSSSSSESSLSSDDGRMAGLNKKERKQFKKDYKCEQKKLRGERKPTEEFKSRENEKKL